MDSNSRGMRLGLTSSVEATEENHKIVRRRNTDPSLDDEISSLIRVCENTKQEIQKDLKGLIKKVQANRDPEAVDILDNKID